MEAIAREGMDIFLWPGQADLTSSLSKPREGSGDRQLLRTARDQGVTLGTQSRKSLRTKATTGTHMESGTQTEAISLGTGWRREPWAPVPAEPGSSCPCGS